MTQPSEQPRTAARVHVRLRHALRGGHRHVRVFIGPDKNQTLALAGTLVLRGSQTRYGKVHTTNTSPEAIERDEWFALRQALATAPSITFDEFEEAEAAAPDPVASPPLTGEAATTPTGKWLQDQLHDDATAFYALTSRQYSIANFVVKVQDLIPQIEREAAAQPAPPAEASGARRFYELLRREREDVGMLAGHLAEIYDYITGGLVSKPNTLPREVIALYEERLDRECADAVAEALATQPTSAEALKLLDAAIRIIEHADHRAGASDGPVGHVRDELTDTEWLALYKNIRGARRYLAATEVGTP